MFEITTRNGNITRMEKYLDGCIAHRRFLWYIDTVDIEEVVLTNEREILNLWRNGKFEVFGGYKME